MSLRSADINSRRSAWTARVVVAIVFVLNMSAALAYVIQPSRYAAGYELEGVAGRVVVQAFGILFLMWNTTYPLVIVNPVRYRSLFTVVLVQQSIGLLGETLLLLSLPPGHDALYRTGIRFIVFDGLGLLVMLVVFLTLRNKREAGVSL